MITPLVSVIMPVYNAENYLREAIESILNQTYTNFEFIIIDDNSTDNSLKIIQSYKDPRIKLLQNNSNLGVTKTLNIGLKNARGKYIARMDADDISLPTRLEKQVGFFLKNPDYCLISSFFLLIPDNYLIKLPVTDKQIKAAIIFHNPVCHPAVMVNRSVIPAHELYYDEKYLYSQDQDLWYRLSKYGKFYNLPEVLLKYRLHKTQISSVKADMQKYYSKSIKLAKLHDFLNNNIFGSIEFISKLLSDKDEKFNKNDFIELKNWILNLNLYNKKYKKVDDKQFRIQLANLLIRFFNHVQYVNFKLLVEIIIVFMKIGRFPKFIVVYFYERTFKKLSVTGK